MFGLLSAGWRWGTTGHTDGSETQVIHYFLDGFSDPNNALHTALATQTWATVANITLTQVFNLNDAEIVIHNTTEKAISYFAGYSGVPNQAVAENTQTTVTGSKTVGKKTTTVTNTFDVGDLGQVHTYIPSDNEDYTAAPSSTDWLPDSAAWIDIIHEIGHALGLMVPP